MARYSIILPVRNGGEYVKECVNSIFQQSYTGFNLHVLDNCSTDGTPEWIESLRDERIVLYRSEIPLSMEANWARIGTIPRNEFMTMIGHDDLMFPHYLQEMEVLIARHPGATLYQTHFTYIDGNGAYVRSCQPMDEMQYAHEFLAFQIARTLDSTGTGYMMRSADFNAMGGMPAHYPNLLFADYSLWVRLIAIGYKATSFRECYSYRLHQSVSRTTNGMVYQQAFGEYVQFLKEMMQKHPEIQEVITRYGKKFLLYFCESLSHRLLKTPVANRSLKVTDLIKKCEGYAAELIPGQHFAPMDVFRIKIAAQLDDNELGRGLFNLFKKFQR